MQLDKLTINKNDIRFKVTLNSEADAVTVDGEKRSIIAHEAPLPGLPKAFSALRSFCAASLDIPEPEAYAEKVHVNTIALLYTQAGTRSVQFEFKVELNSRKAYLHKMKTPFLQIDDNAVGESGEIAVDAASLKLIMKAIQHAQKYAEGERSQTRLDLDSKALNEVTDKGKEDGPSLF